jgi:hypothetical protein
MKLIGYTTTNTPDKIRPATPKRNWMDSAVNKNPYKCLPLSMANSWGWEILSSAKFTAEWNGGNTNQDIKITVHEGTNPPTSHFGEGTLTWHTGYLFNTEYPYGMYVNGIPNSPKPNVIPLTGIVETYWLPFTFTMNWKFTQPGVFTMDIGEPYCQIFPIDMTVFDGLEPEIRSLEDNPELSETYWEWNMSRYDFLSKHRLGHIKNGEWQKNYFQGTGCPVHKTEKGEKSLHTTKPTVNNFIDKQTSKFKMPQKNIDTLHNISKKENVILRRRSMVNRLKEIKKIKNNI